MSASRVRAGRALLATAAAVNLATLAHAVVNARLWRVPAGSPPPVAEPVSVLVPARDEAGRIGGCLAALRAQAGVPRLEILVLDDGSTDGTAAEARAAAGDDPRVRVLDGGDGPLPGGWLGKPWACHRLAGQARGDVLVFVDADVQLAPHAVAASVALLRAAGLDLVSPFPRQVTASAAERLVQPLLAWSVLSTLPLRLAERSRRPALSAANGQLIVVDAGAYRRAGGHAAVREQVIDDLGLARAVKQAGGRVAAADGTRLAACRMYDGWPALRAGYAKSLWTAFGSPAGAAAIGGSLVLTGVLPAAAAVRGSRLGMVGYAASVASRVVTGRRAGDRVWPDALAHPASVVMFVALLADSLRARRAGRLAWKGRAI